MVNPSMHFSFPLTPSALELITLPSGRTVSVAKARPIFRMWKGKPIVDTYGGKLVLNINGEPAFAEIATLRILQGAGWHGVWVDTFGRKYRTSSCPKNEVVLPNAENIIMQKITDRIDSNKGGWDLFCWKAAIPLFVELKRRAHDHIRKSQIQWLEAAFACGLPLESFLIVEWSLSESEN